MIGAAIEVVSGQQYVEVKPRGLSKGATVKKIMHCIRPNFVLCLGDDKSDEEMFVAFEDTEEEDVTVFACTVGQKPSHARFYVNDNRGVVSLLSQLATNLASDADASV